MRFLDLAALAVFFASGVTGLVYEVLWLRELELLVGGTARASAVVLAVFFLGLAAGGRFWGRRVAVARRALAMYAGLELGVAISATVTWGLRDVYAALYPVLFAFFRDSAALLLLAKAGVAAALLFPPAFFMGGTLPVISQYLVRGSGELGRRVATAYALNTLGAALGAAAAGFYLPLALGYEATYRGALAVTAALAAVAWVLSRCERPNETTVTAPSSVGAVAGSLSPRALRALAFLSGALTLGLEVLWTHMFAQVLQNSVYTFGAILVVFLLALAGGAALARSLAARLVDGPGALGWLLAVSGLLVGLSAWLFDAVTGGLAYLGGDAGWAWYMIQVLGAALLVMGPPALVLGMMLPWLLGLAEGYSERTGHTVGDLVALNTVGATVGALIAGFAALDWLGLWGAVRLAGAFALVTSLLLFAARPRGQRIWAPAIGLLLLLSVLDPGSLPAVHLRPAAAQQSLVALDESGAGSVAVVRRGESLRMKVNNHYVLGGTGAREVETLQGHLPLLMHKSPESAFFLGLGTGITAGAALDHPVQRVVVTELVPGVVDAARRYFEPYINGLFEDPRVDLVRDDGRSYLAASRERFDVIVGDLFIPWRQGAATLYSRGHFRSVRDRLTVDGVFVQWLPMYQLTREQLAVIARTMLAAFPQVTVWRGDFFSERPILGLAARRQASPLTQDHRLLQLMAKRKASDPARARERIPLLAHYCGNLGLAPEVLGEGPINTRDHPITAFRAPMAQRRQRANETDWLAGKKLIRFLEALRAAVPPARDPNLTYLSPAQRGLVDAGFALHRAQVLKDLEHSDDAKRAMAAYRAKLSSYFEASDRG